MAQVGPRPPAIAAYTGVDARQMSLAASPDSDEMVLIISDTNKNEFALVWDGSSWGNQDRVGRNRQARSHRHQRDLRTTQRRRDGRLREGPDQRPLSHLEWQPVGVAKGRSPHRRDRPVRRVGRHWRPIPTVIASAWRCSPRAKTCGWPCGTAAPGTPPTNSAATIDTNDRNYPNIAIAFESQSGELLATYGTEATTVSYRTWTTGWRMVRRASRPELRRQGDVDDARHRSRRQPHHALGPRRGQRRELRPLGRHRMGNRQPNKKSMPVSPTPSRSSLCGISQCHPTSLSRRRMV